MASEESFHSSPPEPRGEIPFPSPSDVPHTAVQFLENGNVIHGGHARPMKKYTRGRDGLHAHGWSEWATGSETKFLGRGAHGGVRLVYKLEDKGLPPQRRRFAALKAQRLDNGTVSHIWSEIMIMKSVKHQHVIDFFAAFAVTPPTGDFSTSGQFGSQFEDDPDAWLFAEQQVGRGATSPQSDEVWLLMQFGDAGDMKKEISRYPQKFIPETGCRYYIKQICSAVKYLHSKEITHNDLYVRNVLLHYMADGVTKSCLLCDFGLSEIHPLTPVGLPADIKNDVRATTQILVSMMTGSGIYGVPAPAVPAVLTHSAQQIRDLAPNAGPATIGSLLTMTWFNDGPSVPPVPDRPRTPLTLPISPLKADSPSGTRQSSPHHFAPIDSSPLSPASDQFSPLTWSPLYHRSPSPVIDPASLPLSPQSSPYKSAETSLPGNVGQASSPRTSSPARQSHSRSRSASPDESKQSVSRASSPDQSSAVAASLPRGRGERSPSPTSTPSTSKPQKKRRN